MGLQEDGLGSMLTSTHDYKVCTEEGETMYSRLYQIMSITRKKQRPVLFCPASLDWGGANMDEPIFELSYAFQIPD